MAKKLLATLNGAEVVDTTTEEDAVLAQVREEYNTVEKPNLDAKINLKNSAKAKLIAGEALTEDEANTIVL
tara:strand:- start:24 stop:236 length:213 start_codon:yes stop_codon:yes gene_type:complete